MANEISAFLKEVVVITLVIVSVTEYAPDPVLQIV